MMTPDNAAELDFRKKHTVCDAMLWDYLQGKLDPAEALLMATHYHLSPEARKRANELNECAAVGLEAAQPVAMKCSAQELFKKCCAAKAAKEEACADEKASLPVPKPLQSQVGKGFDSVKWQAVVPGLAEKRLKLCGSAFSVRLLKMDKGVSVPAHTHAAKEISLVLHGLLSDEGELFKVGDVNYQKADPQRLHSPQAAEECICLVIVEDRSRFPGILGAFINPILRWGRA